MSTLFFIMFNSLIRRPNRWRGKGIDEEGFDAKTGKVLVKVDPRYFRPAEVE